jgi:hypothetical protein
MEDPVAGRAAHLEAVRRRLNNRAARQEAKEKAMEAFVAAIQPYVSIVKDIATIASLAIAAIVAIKGLQTWRRQLQGTADYDLAKRLLKAAYRLRDSLQAVRNPFMSAGEIQHAMKEAGLEFKPTDEQFNAASTAAAYQLRWKPVVEAYQALELEVIEAEALWGPSAKSAIIAIRKTVNSLSVAIDLTLRDMQPGARGILDNESRQTFQRILYSISHKPEDDAFLKELTDATAEMEAIARPYLKRQDGA